MLKNMYGRTKQWRLLITVAITLNSASCVATSRIGTAEVSDQNGQPCFSIPSNAETMEGLPLITLAVTDINLLDGGRKLPPESWHFVATNLGAPPKLFPDKCVRYGEAPPATRQRTLKPLELFHPYIVSVGARPKDSNLSAYTAEFCITMDETGRRKIQVISSDRRLGEQRYQVCTKQL